jgi:hypothetical protein
MARGDHQPLVSNRRRPPAARIRPRPACSPPADPLPAAQTIPAFHFARGGLGVM